MDEDDIRPKRTERTGNGKLETRMEKLEEGDGKFGELHGKGGLEGQKYGRSEQEN